MRIHTPLIVASLLFGTVLGATSVAAQFITPEEALLLDYFGQEPQIIHLPSSYPASNPVIINPGGGSGGGGGSGTSYYRSNLPSDHVNPQLRARDLLASANYRRSTRQVEVAYTSGPVNLSHQQKSDLIHTGTGSALGFSLIVMAMVWAFWQFKRNRQVLKAS